jgi:hypothetical protein
MTKRQLIDEIITKNQTAQASFLAQFADDELREYLRHLKWLKQPRLSGDTGRFDKYFKSAARPVEEPSQADKPSPVQIDEEIPPAITNEQPSTSVETTIVVPPAFPVIVQADNGTTAENPPADPAEPDGLYMNEPNAESRELTYGADDADDLAAVIEEPPNGAATDPAADGDSETQTWLF